jgi:hypothetical protein
VQICFNRRILLLLRSRFYPFFNSRRKRVINHISHMLLSRSEYLLTNSPSTSEIINQSLDCSKIIHRNFNNIPKDLRTHYNIVGHHSKTYSKFFVRLQQDSRRFENTTILILFPEWWKTFQKISQMFKKIKTIQYLSGQCSLTKKFHFTI